MSMSVGMRYLASLIDSGDVKEFTASKVSKDLFKPVELEVYEFVEGFVYSYKALPTKDTVIEQFPDMGLPKAPETPAYYADQMRDRYISDTIKAGYTETKKALTKENMDTDEAVRVLSDTLVQIHKITNESRIMDFKESADFLKEAYTKKKVQGMDGTILTGYPSVDSISGGLEGGDVLSIVGRPALGKTFSTLYTGLHAWDQQGKNVLYVSMEMNLLKIQQRLASMKTKYSLTQLKKAQFATNIKKGFFAAMESLKEKPNSYWIVDGNMTATVEDIWKLTMQLHPDLVIVDGAYLLHHPNPRIGKYDRVGENARLLKSMVAAEFDIPVIESWQFNREAVKKMQKNKDAKTGLEDIGYSDEIGQISSLVLGLTQSESVETIKRRKVEILKGRDGETGEFYINWDFFNMDFGEIDNTLKLGDSSELYAPESGLVIV